MAAHLVPASDLPAFRAAGQATGRPPLVPELAASVGPLMMSISGGATPGVLGFEVWCRGVVQRCGAEVWRRGVVQLLHARVAVTPTLHHPCS